MEQRRRRRRIGLLVAALLWVSGCTYDSREPGLFGRSDPSSPSRPPPAERSVASASLNPDLPVVGDAMWTSGDVQHIRVRIAVHAVRRIPGATVLDWSVTPVRAPGLERGDALPDSLTLGLTRLGEDDANIFLVDSSARRVYRPLTTTAYGRPTCLCSPLRVAERHLVLGRTQLLQIAFPPLPADLSTIDVDISTVPAFWHVPVTNDDLVPAAVSPTDLADLGEIPLPGPSAPTFAYGARQQRFYVSVDEVLSADTFTSLRWTIHSLSAGPGLDSASAPPLAEDVGQVPQLVAAAASGPQVLPSGSKGKRLRARLMSVRDAPSAAVECLCTDFRGWATSLEEENQKVSVVTNMPPMPVGTQRVDVVFPGLPGVSDIEVRRATDGALRSAAPAPGRSRSWSYSSISPPAGWSIAQWPTPLPEPDQLSRYRATVETLVR